MSEQKYLWVRYNVYGGIVGQRFTDAEMEGYLTDEPASARVNNGWTAKKLDENTIEAYRYGRSIHIYKRVPV